MQCGGDELAKVLMYYGHEPQVGSSVTKIICPFHGDVNPSMIADFSEGSFYCFGCCASGDAYDFVRMMNPAMDEVRCWSLYFRILQSKKVRNVEAVKIRRKRDSSLDDIARDYYYNLPKTDWSDGQDVDVCAVRDYMLGRGFTARTLGRCGARYAYSSQYPIVFPMLDNGEFKGWVRRTTTKEVEEKRKYLYNTGFSRETTLVGDYGRKPYVMVVEGYMDRLKVIQNGMGNVVALLGWKMTRTQEKKLKDAGIDTIISALDNDACGRKGTEYLKTRFRKVYRFRYMKGIKDPGDMDATMFWRMYAKTMEVICDDEGVLGRKDGSADGRADSRREARPGGEGKENGSRCGVRKHVRGRDQSGRSG